MDVLQRNTIHEKVNLSVYIPEERFKSFTDIVTTFSTDFVEKLYLVILCKLEGGE